MPSLPSLSSNLWLSAGASDKIWPNLQAARFELVSVDAAHLVGESLLKSLSIAKFFPNPPNTVIQPQKPQIYKFENFRVDVSNRQLLRDGEQIALPAKAFDMLVALLESGERLVGKDELFSRVWPDQIVEESNLTVQVSAIRKALGDRTSNPKYLMTVPGHGYRFIGAIQRLELDQEEVVIERHSISRIQSDNDEKTPQTLAHSNVTQLLKEGRQRLRTWQVSILVGGIILTGLLITYFVFKRRQSAPNTPIRSIAVLPFKPLESASRNESWELGIADTLITRLGSIKNLQVRPTPAVRKYSGLEQDPVLAGKELNADAVLDGTIQKSDDRIRITVRVIRVADGLTLWSGSFDDRYADIFAVQDSISSKVVATLALTLGNEENQRFLKRYTENPAAYEAYVRGRYHWNKQTPSDFQKAIESFHEAIALDSQYALAYAGLADSHNMTGYWGNVPPREAFPKAKDAAISALRIDESLGEAHAALAYAEFEYDWNIEGAESSYKRAIDLNPGYASAHQWYAEYLMVGARFDEAATELKRAREIDPLSQPVSMISAALPYLKQRYDETIQQLERVVELDDNFGTAYDLLAICYARKGMYEKAIANYEREFSLMGETPQSLAVLRKAYETGGARAYWLAHVELLKARSKRTYVSPIFIAFDYAELRDNEKALEWLEKAFLDRSGWLLELNVDPSWDNIRTDQRFKSLVNRVKSSSLS